MMLKVNDKLLIKLADDAAYEYRMDHAEPKNYVMCNGIGLDGKPYRLWYYVSDELIHYVSDVLTLLKMIDYSAPSSIEDEDGTCIYYRKDEPNDKIDEYDTCIYRKDKPDDKIEEISISCKENDIVQLNRVYEEYKTFTLEDKLQAVDVYDVERGDVYKPITDEEQYRDRQYDRAMYLKVITDTKMPVAELPDYVWQENLITITELEARTLISQGVKVGYAEGPIYHGSHEGECYYNHISTQSELDDFIGKNHITKAQLSVSPAYVLSKDEIISRDYDAVKMIAEYENANKVPMKERTTEWFGDYAMYTTKLRSELKPNQVLNAWRKVAYVEQSPLDLTDEQLDEPEFDEMEL